MNTFRLDLAKGFPVHLSQHILDTANNDLILFDISGPKQAIRATWARLKSRQTYHYMLGGNAKLQKNPGHHLIKQDLPCGWSNWTWISRQAIPNKLDPSLPVYFWYQPDEDKNEKRPPKNFTPIFAAASPYPNLPDWTDYLWTAGRDMELITRLSNATAVRAYKLAPRNEQWKQLIKTGFITRQIDLGIPMPKEPPTDDETQPFPIVTKHPQFPLGDVVMTRPVYYAMAEGALNPAPYLHRHAKCDWGDMDAQDKRSNYRAIHAKERIFSSYLTDLEEYPKLWIITEADRSSTCILFPEDY